MSASEQTDPSRRPIGPDTPDWELYRSADPANGDLGRMGAAKQELARRQFQWEEARFERQYSIARVSAIAAVAAAVAATFSAAILILQQF